MREKFNPLFRSLFGLIIAGSACSYSYSERSFAYSGECQKSLPKVCVDNSGLEHGIVIISWRSIDDPTQNVIFYQGGQNSSFTEVGSGRASQLTIYLSHKEDEKSVRQVNSSLLRMVYDVDIKGSHRFQIRSCNHTACITSDEVEVKN